MVLYVRKCWVKQDRGDVCFLVCRFVRVEFEDGVVVVPPKWLALGCL